jgi:hypothetical protein
LIAPSQMPMSCAGAETQFDPAAGDQVEAGGAAAEHRGVSQRQVRHIRRHADPAGACRDHRQQGPRVEKPRLVRVVLHGHQVEPGLLGELCERDHPVRVGRRRCREDPEQQVVPVVRHRCLPRRSPVSFVVLTK